MTRRIVFVSSDVLSIPPRFGGAAETYVYGISKVLSKMDLKIHVITLGEDGTYIKENIIFHNFPLDKRLTRIHSVHFRLICNLIDVTYKILRILTEIKKIYGSIDLIYTHYITTSIAPILYKKIYDKKLRLIHHYHHEPNPNAYFVRERAQANLEKWIAKKCDVLYTVSSYLKRRVVRLLEVDEKKVRVVYNAINTKEFHYNEEYRCEIRKKLGIADQEKMLLYVGRIIPKKGLHVVIQALPLILKQKKNVKLVIIGPLGDYRSFEKTYFNRMMRRAPSLKDHLTYVGFVPPGLEVSKYYSASDLLVFPSFCNEACPTVLLEAMACSLPIVAHNIGAVEEIAKENFGVLVKPGNVGELAEKILEMLGKSDSREMEEDFVIDFSLSAVAQKLYDESFYL